MSNTMFTVCFPFYFGPHKIRYDSVISQQLQLRVLNFISPNH